MESIKFAKPGDANWVDLEEKRVVLSDEDVRVKEKIIPQLPDLATILNLDCFKKIKVKTSATKPGGVDISLDSNNTTLVQGSGFSELRIRLTRSQLRSAGLLPSAEADSVFEKAWFDNGQLNPNGPSNLTDGQAFGNQMPGELRGKSTRFGTLTATQPNSPPDASFIKAAGIEIIIAEIGSVISNRRQVMNQADYFYYSGHGRHMDGKLLTQTEAGEIFPSDVQPSWNKDLNVAIFAGCAVLDINDYNNNYGGLLNPVRALRGQHHASPGKRWAQTGPDRFLGYNYRAPFDNQGAASIITAWIANRPDSGDIDAWRLSNDSIGFRNACAIEVGVGYFFFKQTGTIRNPVFTWTFVPIEEW